MNINLMSQLGALHRHGHVLNHAVHARTGRTITGPPLLLPDEEVVGVYQVWWPATDGLSFFHVTPDGLVVEQEEVRPEQFLRPTGGTS